MPLAQALCCHTGGFELCIGRVQRQHQFVLEGRATCLKGLVAIEHASGHAAVDLAELYHVVERDQWRTAAFFQCGLFLLLEGIAEVQQRWKGGNDQGQQAQDHELLNQAKAVLHTSLLH